MTENNTCGNGGCGCSATTVRGAENSASGNAKKTVEIEFLYLDLNVCEQCRGSESNLDEALADVSRLIEKTGAAVSVKKIHVESYEQALALGFISSPTIRINGRDVALQVEENYCRSCSELSGSETFCRVWNFQGEKFSTVPKPLVVDAVLREIYGSGNDAPAAKISAAQIAGSLENLKRFFAGRAAQDGDAKAAVGEAVNSPAPPAATVRAGGCGCA